MPRLRSCGTRVSTFRVKGRRQSGFRGEAPPADLNAEWNRLTVKHFCGCSAFAFPRDFHVAARHGVPNLHDLDDLDAVNAHFEFTRRRMDLHRCWDRYPELIKHTNDPIGVRIEWARKLSDTCKVPVIVAMAKSLLIILQFGGGDPKWLERWELPLDMLSIFRAALRH